MVTGKTGRLHTIMHFREYISERIKFKPPYILKYAFLCRKMHLTLLITGVLALLSLLSRKAIEFP